MIKEYFGENDSLEFTAPVMTKVKNLFRQERDWTCSIACLRSILSSKDIYVSEDDIIDSEKLQPGPHYSKEIKDWGILKSVDFKCGAIDQFTEDGIATKLYKLLSDGYCIMIDTMINYDHWLVILGIFPNGSNTTILLYDPYYNEEKLMRFGEVCSMWISGDFANNGVKFDYVAVKAGANTMNVKRETELGKLLNKEYSLDKIKVIFYGLLVAVKDLKNGRAVPVSFIEPISKDLPYWRDHMSKLEFETAIIDCTDATALDRMTNRALRK